MARMSRAEVFDPNEVAVVRAFGRTVRRCFLMGDDPISGKNFDHLIRWIEQYLQQFAAYFGIDLLCFRLLSNHFHLILRSRPDVVATWDDEEAARRWLLLCPNRRKPDGTAMEPTQPEINSIAGCPIKREEIRSRLTDEASLLACAAYVDLNPIGTAMCERLEDSDFTSVQRRIEAEQERAQDESPASVWAWIRRRGVNWSAILAGCFVRLQEVQIVLTPCEVTAPIAATTSAAAQESYSRPLTNFNDQHLIRSS
jgi:hypothetical protein